MKKYAKKLREGLSRGDATIKSMAIDHATVQRYYKMMKKDSFDGTIPFYMCIKLCDEVMGKTKDYLVIAEKMGKPFPTDEELANFIEETDKDVLFCAVLGALMQSKDKVGAKCYEALSKIFVKTI